MTDLERQVTPENVKRIYESRLFQAINPYVGGSLKMNSIVYVVISAFLAKYSECSHTEVFKIVDTMEGLMENVECVATGGGLVDNDIAKSPLKLIIDDISERAGAAGVHDVDKLATFESLRRFEEPTVRVSICNDIDWNKVVEIFDNLEVDLGVMFIPREAYAQYVQSSTATKTKARTFIVHADSVWQINLLSAIADVYGYTPNNDFKYVDSENMFISFTGSEERQPLPLLGNYNKDFKPFSLDLRLHARWDYNFNNGQGLTW